MEGKIVGINYRRGLIAIRTEQADVTVAELLGGYTVELKDEIQGNLYSLGGETFYNSTKLEEMDVFVEGVHCSFEDAKLMIS
ncbi:MULTISPECIES: hypothetical protein [Halomonas]|uniref:Uncharacterized protein n=1 Tax=Halomonas halophila TaxID=29573 RepID=A0ABQ0TZ90_9GAMM|nr:MULTISPECIES: hypothetical protein [Halomonas]MDR5889674.1 hypothetical protein [Halomonas salina]WJY06356.1 hypothetical protein QWG60_11625 [Halomonas halophila]GEK71557.1 hypothetical protein HHA04nite_01010 [Halomonas halophila]